MLGILLVLFFPLGVWLARNEASRSAVQHRPKQVSAPGWSRLLIPVRSSGCEIRQFEHPRQAEVIGRVIGVAMRIANSVEKTGEHGSKR
jgi:hypothetical protein